MQTREEFFSRERQEAVTLVIGYLLDNSRIRQLADCQLAD